MNIAENDTTGVLSHRGYIRSHRCYIMSHWALLADKYNLGEKTNLILYLFYQQMWRGMDQDSRESAATTIIHRKTQRNEKVKFQKHNKSDWKKRDFHTSHAECPLLI